MRFAEFEVRSLPMQLLVVGETLTSDEKLIPKTKPVLEAAAVAVAAVAAVGPLSFRAVVAHAPCWTPPRWAWCV